MDIPPLWLVALEDLTARMLISIVGSDQGHRYPPRRGRHHRRMECVLALVQYDGRGPTKGPRARRVLVLLEEWADETSSPLWHPGSYKVVAAPRGRHVVGYGRDTCLSGAHILRAVPIK